MQFSSLLGEVGRGIDAPVGGRASPLDNKNELPLQGAGVSGRSLTQGDASPRLCPGL
jgi:hypothetical protein